MFVVLEKHCVDYEGHETVNIWGPFETQKEADKFVETEEAKVPHHRSGGHNRAFCAYVKSRHPTRYNHYKDGEYIWIDEVEFEAMEVKTII